MFSILKFILPVSCLTFVDAFCRYFTNENKVVRRNIERYRITPIQRIIETTETLIVEELPNLETTEPKNFPHLTDVLSRTFQCDPQWLDVRRNEEEYESFSQLSIVDENRVTAMLPRYQSFKHYYETIEPLLAMECWRSILDDYEKYKKNDKYFKVIPYSIHNTKTLQKPNRSYLQLEMVVSADDLEKELHPFKGDLFLFHYQSNRRYLTGSSMQTVFAYVTELRKTFIRPKTKFNSHLLTMVDKPHTLITFTLLTKEFNVTEIQMHMVYTLQKISNIVSSMRMDQALQQLPKSPLMNFILHPEIENYQLPSTNNAKESLVTKKRLNTKQLEAVMRVQQTHVQNLPKICLIEGPPGTGKSTVIVNLIMQILHGGYRSNPEKQLKILVCAPSNTAVDAIVVKLLQIRRTSGTKYHFSLVRIGCMDKMHPEVKKVSLDEMSKKNVKELCETHCEKCEPKLFLMNPHDEKQWLLRNAEVIASTLSSSYTNHMEMAFYNKNDDLVCIVDEASQCTEPESLIPLMLGVRTLILVGDPKQLPATVLSQKAKDLGFDQSLFARISGIFNGTSVNPIIKLDVQYRMTDPVALFPNNYFYDGMLKNAAEVPILPFHSYRVINHDSAQDIVKLSNSGEADFVAKLIHAMLVQIARIDYHEGNLPITVGIITGYQLQKTQLIKKINQRIGLLKDKEKIKYDVNTVDSFQGQERDVIIMSCVRSQGIGFLNDPHRLCVALTRAKHSLIICGNFKTFNNDRMWHTLINDAKSRGVYFNVKSKADLREIERHIIRSSDTLVESMKKLNLSNNNDNRQRHQNKKLRII